MQLIILLLKVMPVFLEIVKAIQQHRLTQQATDEMLADLEQTADYLITRSTLARKEVNDDPSNDPYNRDNITARSLLDNRERW